jgi:hypothetical protein
MMAVPTRSQSSVAILRLFRVFFLVDTLEYGWVLPPALCDNGKALGKSLFLKTPKGIVWSHKRLPRSWRDEMGCRKGFSGYSDLGSQQGSHYHMGSDHCGNRNHSHHYNTFSPL